MKKHWYLLVNRVAYRVFEQKGVEQGFELLMEESNSQGGLKNQDLVSDKMGRGAPGYNTYAAGQDPKEHVLENFSKQIASLIHDRANKNEFQSLVIFAEPHTLGCLKKALSGKTKALLRETINKDLGNISNHDVIEHLKAVSVTREAIAET